MTTWQVAISTIAAIAGNYLPLRAGTILRACYFKRCCGLPLTHYAALAVAQAAVGATAAGMLLSAVLLAGGFAEQLGQAGIVITLVCSLLPALALFSLPMVTNRFSFESHKVRLVGRLTQAVELIGKNRRRVAIALAWHLAFVGISSARLWLVYDTFSVSVPMLACLFITAAGTLSMFLSITPGGVGIREGTISAVGVMFGVPLETGFLVATVERAMLMLAALSVGGPSLLWISRKAAGDCQEQDSQMLVPTTGKQVK